jgi:hypothetical protein
MQGLDRLLSRPSQLLALRTLFHADQPLCGREVERRTGLSNRAAMVALDALVELAAVRCETTTRAHLYTLNRNSYLVARALKPAFEAEDVFWEDLRKTVRRVVHPRPIAGVATGPLARNETDPSGRLGLILIFSSGRNRIRAFRTMTALEEAVWDRYAVRINATLMDSNTADLDEHDALWRRVEREGILLFGTLP